MIYKYDLSSLIQLCQMVGIYLNLDNAKDANLQQK